MQPDASHRVQPLFHASLQLHTRVQGQALVGSCGSGSMRSRGAQQSKRVVPAALAICAQVHSIVWDLLIAVVHALHAAQRLGGSALLGQRVGTGCGGGAGGGSADAGGSSLRSSLLGRHMPGPSFEGWGILHPHHATVRRTCAFAVCTHEVALRAAAAFPACTGGAWAALGGEPRAGLALAAGELKEGRVVRLLAIVDRPALGALARPWARADLAIVVVARPAKALVIHEERGGTCDARSPRDVGTTFATVWIVAGHRLRNNAGHVREAKKQAIVGAADEQRQRRRRQLQRRRQRRRGMRTGIAWRTRACVLRPGGPSEREGAQLRRREAATHSGRNLVGSLLRGTLWPLTNLP